MTALQSLVHSCSHCAMKDLCIPLGVSRDELTQIEGIVNNSNALKRGESIFRQGDELDKIYAVKSGMVKSVVTDEHGNERVVSFHLAGELVGLDGIYPEKYVSTSQALTTTVMCAINYDELETLCSKIPSLQHQMFRLLSRDIYESNLSRSEEKEQTAEQKLASFIQNLSVRYEARGFSPTDFPLVMPRQDIANHLGLAPETVSRLLKRFKESGVLALENRNVRLSNLDKLDEIIACESAA